MWPKNNAIPPYLANVTLASYDPGDPSKLPSGRYGATYEIQHGTDHYQYTHVYPLRNADGTLRYGIGSQIQAGTQIGFYARIGWSDRPHLHVSRLLYNDKTKKWDIPDDPGTIP